MHKYLSAHYVYRVLAYIIIYNYMMQAYYYYYAAANRPGAINIVL